MKNKIPFLLIAVLGIASCKPKDNTPPEPEEYFNCEINGKYWTYKADMSGFNPCPGIGAGYSGSLGYVLAGRDCKGFPKTEIVMYITGGNSFPDRDTFELGGGDRAEIVDPYYISSGQSSFYTDNTYTGRLIFTQRQADWIKGIFYFDVFDPAKNQIIHITNGKFSIKL